MEENSIFEILRTIFKKKPKELSEVKKEIKEVLKDFKDEKILGEFEERLILEIITLKNLDVKDLVIPRNILKGLNINLKWEEVKHFVSNYPHTFYPVYEKDLDNFVGYVRLKDLIRGMDKVYFNWQDWINEPFILLENISLISALEKLIEKKQEIAFVVDEHSEFTGIIRLKDIVNEILFGEFQPVVIDKNEILVPGTTKLIKIEKWFNIELPKGNFETISGLIIDKLHKIPQKGEKIKIPPLEIEVLEANERKIDTLKIKFRKD
ncbi:MAG: hypothetical protein DRP29_00185 [Thermodesulfobacteriota bacterium]|nr:MAG: hypothetical protein DRP29_00185 [Thermodesulfobacteriota bacterium]